jgi:dihydrofolate reductase
LARVWTAKCDSPTDFSSIASVNPGIGCVRAGGATTVHLRGPETRAATLSCPRDAEYFGADFRLGAYLPMFPPARLVDRQDAVLPILPDGRILLDGRAWEMPTSQNIDVFIDRLKRAGLLVFDPLVEELQHGGATGTMPQRTAQSRFVRAVGLSRRKLQLIERARQAARLLRAGTAIADVVSGQDFWGGQARFQDDKHVTYAAKLLESAGALVLGRATYEVFAASRPCRTGELADRINSLPKYVASHTLTGATWNSQVLPGNAVEAVAKLKESGEGTLLKYGTGSFSRALLEGGQLDELHLWVYPFIAGSGEPLLPGITTTHLDLAEVNEVGNGVVVLTYKPKQ